MKPEPTASSLSNNFILKLQATFSPVAPMILFGGNLNRCPTENNNNNKARLIEIAKSLDEFQLELNKLTVFPATLGA